MSIDRNRILCALAIAAGLLPFSGCGNSDKPAAEPGTVNVVADHGGHDSKPNDPKSATKDWTVSPQPPNK
jgi:hypothetical protein